MIKKASNERKSMHKKFDEREMNDDRKKLKKEKRQ